MSAQRLLSRIVEKVADALAERIRGFRHLSLADLAELLERLLCENWSSVKSLANSVRVGEGCEATVEDRGEYIKYAVEEAKRTADHLVDLAMEALAKHIESLPEGLYSRLSWLLVSHSARTANRIQKLASIMRSEPSLAPLAELAIVLIAVRAAALYRLVSRLEADELKKLMDNIEAFIAACDMEEDTLIEKLGRGALVAIGGLDGAY